MLHRDTNAGIPRFFPFPPIFFLFFERSVTFGEVRKGCFVSVFRRCSLPALLLSASVCFRLLMTTLRSRHARYTYPPTVNQSPSTSDVWSPGRHAITATATTTTTTTTSPSSFSEPLPYQTWESRECLSPEYPLSFSPILDPCPQFSLKEWRLPDEPSSRLKVSEKKTDRQVTGEKRPL